VQPRQSSPRDEAISNAIAVLLSQSPCTLHIPPSCLPWKDPSAVSFQAQIYAQAPGENSRCCSSAKSRLLAGKYVTAAAIGTRRRLRQIRIPDYWQKNTRPQGLEYVDFPCKICECIIESWLPTRSLSALALSLISRRSTVARRRALPSNRSPGSVSKCSAVLRTITSILELLSSFSLRHRVL
jgi:hypothetical protein